MKIPECQHNVPVISGCAECFNSVDSRAIRDDICEIVRMQLGATQNGPYYDPGTPRFRTVEKTTEEIIDAFNEVINIATMMRDEL